MIRAQQKCRNHDDGCHRIRDSQVSPFDPIVSAETIRYRKGSSPEGGPKRNKHHGDEDEDNRVTKCKRLEGRSDQDAYPGRCRDDLHSIEKLAG